MGEREAQREEEKEGKPVVFLGDVEASIKKQLKDWFYKGLHKEELEEELEGAKAGAAYTERIIGELEKKNKRPAEALFI